MPKRVGGATTGIEWTTHTWNPLIGCSRVSDGCIHCYAEQVAAMVLRTRGPASPYAEVVRQVGGEPRWTGVVRRNTDEKFREMRSRRPTNPPRLVFVNSMSDAFHDRALGEGLTAEVYAEMVANPGHVYQILTKRPENAVRFYAAHPEYCHLPGIWVGTSVEDGRVVNRIDTVRAIPAGLRFLSCEPLIGRVGRLDLTGIGWVIAGGESARPAVRARRMDPAWLRELRDQCVAAGVPFFFKQWGSTAGLAGKGGHDLAVLDGREWKQFPPLVPLGRREPPEDEVERLRAELANLRERLARVTRERDAARSEAERLRASPTAVANDARARAADDTARSIWPHIVRIRKRLGAATTNGEIAAELMRLRVRTPAGGDTWTRMQVHRVRKRMERSLCPAGRAGSESRR